MVIKYCSAYWWSESHHDSQWTQRGMYLPEAWVRNKGFGGDKVWGWTFHLSSIKDTNTILFDDNVACIA